MNLRINGAILLATATTISLAEGVHVVLQDGTRLSELQARMAGLDITVNRERKSTKLLGNGNYARQKFTFKANADVVVKRFELATLKGGHVLGSVPGSPLTTPTRWMSIEDPMAKVEGEASYVERKLPLRKGQSISFTVVFGQAKKGQLRRAFNQYIEAERPRPYEPFLHYNSWYDLGYFDKYTADQCVERVDTFGDELVKKRGVRLSSFLFDDGWDDTSTVWEFHKGFPNGFKQVSDAAHKFGAEPGAWLSPWGGYGKPREERLATGKQAGMEIDSQGYALSGPKYFKRFSEVTHDLVAHHGINQFKFDGTGSPDKQFPGSAFDSDFSAAISLIGSLRAAKPGLFINLTTGTWPSPFWTRYADSIWRGGSDHSFAGEGTWRQKWITYRDGDTFHGVVQKGPLYPLNSLMLHGLIYAQHAQHLADDPGGDFGDEVRTYFASGTQLQEMYITPSLLTRSDWDTLAQCANWSRTHKSELVDTHWVGGDPLAGEVYGWASWNGGKATLCLRNPTSHDQMFSIEPGRVWQLPKLAVYHLSPTLGSQAKDLRIGKGRSKVVTLKPFEVLAWDAEEVRK
ncbi:MAG: enterotoxin [Armatimonadota bacterium]